MNMAQLLRRLFQVPSNVSKWIPIARNIATSKCVCENYEGDGKTIVSILNREYQHLIMVNSYSKLGFRLNNGIFVVGPMVAFPRTILQWNVNDIESITPETLSLFTLLEPKLDIFVLGTGDKRVLPKREVLEFLQGKNIHAEILSTEQACSTFNFLNVEGRCVAGAFIPPKEVVIYEDEVNLIQDSHENLGYLM